ncbi:hypothetical protein XA68_14981 [Ophiocordyceps unilateralis]|uniref:Uncharacterized protein n=1 Tax=Ophiocordyceps unilateralis TaxID=268505 RepID=A0A2A9PMN9_OPHUN|nr:hypothetical protein XA68_14981 [Ophiocordyceps unilateralis]
MVSTVTLLVALGGLLSAATANLKPTTIPQIIDDCESRTVCIDMINSCGNLYGTCIPACLPRPTFTPQPCTLSSVVKTYPTP